jgi:hypothetical protein
MLNLSVASRFSWDGNFEAEREDPAKRPKERQNLYSVTQMLAENKSNQNWLATVNLILYAVKGTFN